MLFQTFWRMPLIYVAMFLTRGLSIALFKPLFDLVGSGLSNFCTSPYPLFSQLSSPRHLSVWDEVVRSARTFNS